jgi:surface polysaccharide O-acyltransferase-like enzyme
VVIHVPFPGAFGNFVSCLSRFAVPLFFAISGYFSFGTDGRRLTRQMGHIFRLNLLATALAIFCKYQQMSDWDAGVLLKLQQLMPDPEHTAKWLFLHINPFSGELWYLTAIFFCYVGVWAYVCFFQKEEKDYRLLYRVSLVLFLIRFLAGDLLRFAGVKIPFYIFRDGWFLGLPMFALGIFLRQNQDAILSRFPLTGCRFLLLSAVCFGLSFAQWEFMDMPELPLGTVAQVALLILFTAAHPKLGRSGMAYRMVAKFSFLSTAMYILHYRFYGYYTERFQQPVQERLGASEAWLRPVLIIFVTLVVSILLQLLLDVTKKLRSSFAR